MRPTRLLTLLTIVPSLTTTLVACALDDDPTGGPVQITIEQSFTSQSTTAGAFRMSGRLTDDGTTTEELTFGGPLDRPPVPATFRRTLSGKNGTLVVRGSATLTFSSPTAGTVTGTWQVESATGRYAALAGAGTLSGNADFGATPPTARLTYDGELKEK